MKANCLQITFYMQTNVFEMFQVPSLGFARFLTALKDNALTITTWTAALYGVVTDLGPDSLDLGKAWETIVVETGTYEGCLCMFSWHGPSKLHLHAFGPDGCTLGRPASNPGQNSK